MQLSNLEEKFNLVSQLLAARPSADEALNKFKQLMDRPFPKKLKQYLNCRISAVV